MPKADCTVTVRGGVAAGSWVDTGLAVFTFVGQPFGKGSWGDCLNSVDILESQDMVEVTVADDPPNERHRVIAVRDDGREFMERVGKLGETTGRRFTAWTRSGSRSSSSRPPLCLVEFRGVPTQWSECACALACEPPDTCNIAGQPAPPG